MRIRSVLLPLAVVAGIATLVFSAARPGIQVQPLKSVAVSENLSADVATLDRLFDQWWKKERITPAKRADDLTILRRLSLALHGTIPSLEEIRRFEADPRPDRLQHWTASLLDDKRFADYFSERLARPFVGIEDGQFVLFRRDRFTDWLAKQLRANSPYDRIVRDIISQEGVWTDKPAANFITSAIANDELDINKLTGRMVRACLGQRIDCAQCHDHKFDHWKQVEFEGIAAHFGQTRVTVGVYDFMNQEYKIDNRTVPPQVPFHPEWLGDSGSRRERLANWMTHPENIRFHRAIANRVWGLMFGTPFLTSRPVDDLPDPQDPDPVRKEFLKPIDFLAEDFRAHGCDLRRLIQMIAASRPFQLESIHTADDERSLSHLKKNWGVFPLIRLRPEQVIGSMLQANHVKTIDQNSHLFVRAARFFRERDFIRDFGDPGDAELEERAGTIPQALLRMNGEFTRDFTKTDALNAAGRIAADAGSDENCVEVCFLTCLTRRPTPEERSQFIAQLSKASDRNAEVQDLYWALFNSPEFSWNH